MTVYSLVQPSTNTARHRATLFGWDAASYSPMKVDSCSLVHHMMRSTPRVIPSINLRGTRCRMTITHAGGSRCNNLMSNRPCGLAGWQAGRLAVWLSGTRESIGWDESHSEKGGMPTSIPDPPCIRLYSIHRGLPKQHCEGQSTSGPWGLAIRLQTDLLYSK